MWAICFCERSVSQCTSTRITLGKLPGTGISVEQRRGTSPKPMDLAYAAGKSELISLVTVKITEMRSDGSRLLARRISCISSTTATCIKAGSSRSIWVAPLTPLTFTCEFYFPVALSRGKGITRLIDKYIYGFYLPPLWGQLDCRQFQAHQTASNNVDL